MCIRDSISSLLDVTDNRVGAEIVAPPRVVRHDPEDPYLVVAADKGTASFSDIANGVAQSYGFWLDDAFASGGSAGYDHKGMGITARGAWESVSYTHLDVYKRQEYGERCHHLAPCPGDPGRLDLRLPGRRRCLEPLPPRGHAPGSRLACPLPIR